MAAAGAMAAAALPGLGIPVVGRERPLDVGVEAAQRDTPGPAYPGRADRGRDAQQQHRQQRVGLNPGEASLAVGATQGRHAVARALEAHQRLGPARRHSQMGTHVGVEAAESQRGVETALGDRAQQRPQARLQPLLEGHDAAQAAVQFEGVRLGEAFDEPTQGARDRCPGCVVCTAFLATAPIAAQHAPGWRWPRRRVPAQRPVRIRQRRGKRREHLGGHGLGASPGRQRLAGHAVRKLAHVPPLGAHRRRTADRQRLARPGVGIVGRRERTAFQRAGIDAAHHAFEGAGGQGLRTRQPDPLGLRRGDARQQPRLGPRHRSGDERGLQGGEIPKRRVHGGQLLELAGGEAEALAGVVAQAGEAQALPRAARDEAPGQGGQRAAQRPLGPGEPPQRGVDARGFRGAARLQADDRRDGHGADSLGTAWGAESM